MREQPAPVAGADRRPTISLCVIARDEEPVIGRCLASVQGVVDELVVLDTGSTDRTPEIAREWGARVESLPWPGDFAVAKNAALERATGDWVLFLDADEVLAAGADRLRDLAAAAPPGPVAYGVLIRNLVRQPEGTTDVYQYFLPRFFRRHPEVRYKGAIHEQLLYREGAEPLLMVRAPAVVIEHDGYSPDEIQRKQKAQRNLPLLLRALAQAPYEPFAHFNLGMQFSGLGDWATAADLFTRAIRLAQYQGRPVADYLAVAYVRGVECLLRVGRRDEARALGEEGAQVAPTPDLCCVLAGLALQENDLAGAEAWYRRALHLDPEHCAFPSDLGASTWRPLHGLAVIAQQQGDLERAWRYLQRALRYAPEQPVLLLLGAEVLTALGRTEAAVAILERVKGLALPGPAAEIVYVNCLEKLGRLQEAYDRLEALVQAHPENDLYRLRLAEFLYDLGEDQAVVAVLDPCLDGEARSDPRLYARLGMALLRLGRAAEAARAFELATLVHQRNQLIAAGRWPAETPTAGESPPA